MLNTRITLWILAALLVGAAVVGAWYWTRAQTPQAVEAPQSAEMLYQASLPNLEGEPQPLSQWRGKVMIVNFWATWCPPCRKEIPEFVHLQEKYGPKGLIFVGIAIDQKDKVSAFSDEMGINYPILLGGMESIDLSRKAGNRLGGLPYTVIVDRKGQIVGTELGGLTEAKLTPIIESLL